MNTYDHDTGKNKNMNTEKTTGMTAEDWDDHADALYVELSKIKCDEALHAELKSLRAHKARLDTELAEMRKVNNKLMAFFQDAAAFTRSHIWHDNIALATLIHDITGIAEDKPCFLPRVSGYAEREREGKPL